MVGEFACIRAEKYSIKYSRVLLECHNLTEHTVYFIDSPDYYFGQSLSASRR